MAEVEGYGGLKDDVGYYILNHIEEVDHHLTGEEIADALGQPRMISRTSSSSSSGTISCRRWRSAAERCGS